MTEDAEIFTIIDLKIKFYQELYRNACHLNNLIPVVVMVAIDCFVTVLKAFRNNLFAAGIDPPPHRNCCLRN